MSRYYMLCFRVKNSQLAKNRRYKGIEVRVTKDEFIKWFQTRDFEGCSVDRIDPKGHYEFSNMRVICKLENIRKDKTKARDGKCECYKCGHTKPLAEFVKESRRKNGYSTICKECEVKRTTARKAA